MTRFHFERPDGPPSNNAQNILIHLNEFVPPQGYDGGVVPQFDLMALENLDIMALEPGTWISLKWQLRTPFTINPGEVPSPQTDFPVKIEGTIPALIGKSKDELIFASTDNLPLDHEIDEFDTLTGKFIAWMKKSLVSDGDIIYAYYDNSLAINVEDKAAVWSNNFVAVYHMSQLSGNILDSTKFGNDGIVVGNPLNATLIGNAKNFVTSADSYLAPATPSLNTTNITVSVWLNAPSYDVLMGIASKAGAPLDQDWVMFVSFGTLVINVTPNGNISTSTLSDGIKQRVAFVVTDTTTLNVYIDKVLVHTQTITAKQTSTISSLEIGSVGGAISFEGIIDEFHKSNDGKSTDWLDTEYNNQRPDSNTFFTIGAEESAPTTFDRMALEVTP